MATNPTLITTPFAESGDKTTPPNTNTPSDGRFSQTLGFPPITAIPLDSGGKAPKREDFNGALNMLANIAFYAQKGWIFQWDSGQTYYAGCIVRYRGSLYECTSDVTSTTNPASDTTHWSKYNILPGVAYAPINSPAFTGTPTAPTPTSGDDSTKIATTAFVKAAISTGGGGVVDSYTNANGDWYRVYSDGWVEQGGIVVYANGISTITLHKPMADNKYNITLCGINVTAAHGLSIAIAEEYYGAVGITTTTFKTSCYSSASSLNHTKSWSVCGMGAST